MLIGLFTGNALQIFFYYLIFLVIDASVSIMAYIFEGERLWVFCGLSLNDSSIAG